MPENPFRVAVGFNENMNCWELELYVGNIESEKQARQFADLLVEWIKEDSPSAWSALVN